MVEPESMSEVPAAATIPPQPLWRRVLPFVIAFGLVGYVVARIDWQTFLTHLRAVDYLRFFAFMTAFVLAVLAADVLATVYVYRRIVAKVSYRDLFVARGVSYLPALLNHHVGQAWLTYFLARRYGVPLARVAGATMVVYATWGGCLLLLATVALPSAGVRLAWMALPLGLGLAYLAVLAAKPARLVALRLLAPLFEIGPLGHLVAMAFRLPHVVVLFLGTWLPFWFFGVRVPLSAALVSVPILMVAVTVPLTPVGLGTRDALAMALFQRYALAGETPEERLAAIAAATMTTAVAILLLDALIGLLMMRTLGRRLGGNPVTAAR